MGNWDTAHVVPGQFASPLLALVLRVMLRCVLFAELMGYEDTFPE